MAATDQAVVLARASEPVRAVLAPNLPEIPAERHDFLVTALEASYWNMLDRAGVTYDEESHDLGYWKQQWQRRECWNRKWQDSIARPMLERGVVRFFVGQSDAAFNSDRKEISRGSRLAGEEALDLFPPETICRILRDGIQATETSAWEMHPAWYGRFRSFDAPADWARVRAGAARWLPEFTPQRAVDVSLLGDADPGVRRYTAMNIAAYQPSQAADSRTIRELVRAVEDKEWVWSSHNWYECGWLGRHSAAVRLLELGSIAHPALPAIRSLIIDEVRERDQLSSQGLLECNPDVLRRIERLYRAIRKSALQNDDELAARVSASLSPRSTK
jgi:hypothetical protein